MGAIKQYIELYEANKAAIDNGSAGVLNAMRPAAFDALAGRELPDEHVEDFEKTSVDAMFAPDYGMNFNRLALSCDIAAAFKCGVPNVSTLLGVVVNDRFVPASTLGANMPAGVRVMSLAEAARLYPAEVERYYGRVASLDSPGTALNTLLAQDGVYIHVDRGVHVSRPVQIVTLDAAPVPMLTARRMLVVAEDDAQVSVLLCDHSMNPAVKKLTSQVVEVVAGRNSRIDLCDIEETDALNSRYSQMYVSQQAGSNLSVGGMTLSCGQTRNEYDIRITGPGCECHLNGMAIGTDRQHVDNCSNVMHEAGGSKSRQLFKYVLDGQSTGAFEGSIEVAHGAALTEAYQSDRNILASKESRMHSKPRLLIYNDDVKCSHGATTGQLDERALFYMQSRGIPREEARMLLMQAFMAEVVDTVRVDSVRDRLRHLVERRLAGQPASCSTCKS